MIVSLIKKSALLALGFVLVGHQAFAAVPVSLGGVGAVPVPLPITLADVEAQSTQVRLLQSNHDVSLKALRLGQRNENFAIYLMAASAVVGGADLVLSYRQSCKDGSATWGFKGFAAFAWSKFKDASGWNGYKGFKNKPMLSACLYVCLGSGIFKVYQNQQNKSLKRARDLRLVPLPAAQRQLLDSQAAFYQQKRDAFSATLVAQRAVASGFARDLQGNATGDIRTQLSRDDAFRIIRLSVEHLGECGVLKNPYRVYLRLYDFVQINGYLLRSLAGKLGFGINIDCDNDLPLLLKALDDGVQVFAQPDGNAKERLRGQGNDRYDQDYGQEVRGFLCGKIVPGQAGGEACSPYVLNDAGVQAFKQAYQEAMPDMARVPIPVYLRSDY